MTFLGNVVASLTAALVMIIVTGLVSAKARWILTAALGRLLDIDIDYVYPNARAAGPDIRSSVERASSVDVFMARGNELQRETFACLLGERPESREQRVRILLPNPSAIENEDWIAQREDELARFDRSFGSGILRAQIETTIAYLTPHLSDNTQLRLFAHPHIGRIIISPGAAFFTPYSATAHGRDSRVYRYRAGGDMYIWLQRLFEQIWNADKTCARPSR